MPESAAARARRLVAQGNAVEDVAVRLGWSPSRVRAALTRGGGRVGRPRTDTAELRVRIDARLHRAAQERDVDVRTVVERALQRALRRTA